MIKEIRRHIFILGLASLLGCKSKIDYSITAKYLNKPAECTCYISYRYPEITSENNVDSNLIALNAVLKSVGEFDGFIDRCNPKSPRYMKSFKRYDCDYTLELQTDSMLSIEIYSTVYYDNDFKYNRFNIFY